jgi:hypothetical protein
VSLPFECFKTTPQRQTRQQHRFLKDGRHHTKRKAMRLRVGTLKSTASMKGQDLEPRKLNIIHITNKDKGKAIPI